MDLKYLGENIRRERKRLGLTLEKFALLVGTSKTTLQRIEKGAKAPNVDLLYEITQLCRKPMEEFIQEEPEEIYRLSASRQKKVVGDDFEVSIVCPYGVISRDMVINYYRGESGAHIKPTQDRGYHWVYVVRGSCLFEHDGRRYTLKPGDSIYYDARKTFWFRVIEDLESIRIAVRA